MAPSFRHRGVKVVVDTTETAEFDIADLKIPDVVLEVAINQFEKIPNSSGDMNVGGICARNIGEYDYIFNFHREEANLVVTISGVIRHIKPSKLREALKNADRIATLRGVLGV